MGIISLYGLVWEISLWMGWYGNYHLDMGFVGLVWVEWELSLTITSKAMRCSAKETNSDATRWVKGCLELSRMTLLSHMDDLCPDEG